MQLCQRGASSAAQRTPPSRYNLYLQAILRFAPRLAWLLAGVGFLRDEEAGSPLALT